MNSQKSIKNRHKAFTSELFLRVGLIAAEEGFLLPYRDRRKKY